MDQQYCLKWSNHLSNLSNVFLSLLEREALCDVTLSVGVEQKIKAHQTMLSACSPYFESLFIEHTHPNPIVHLNVEFEDLKAIIEYIYKGEVNIAHTCLPRFLKAANDLQVKGLVDTNKDYKNESHSETNSPKSSPIPPDTDSNIDDFKNDTRERHEFDRHHRESFNNNDDYSYSRKSDSETRLDDEPRHLLLGKRNRQRSQDCDNSLLTHKPHPYPPRHLSDSSQELHASPKPKSRRMISIEGNDSDGRRTSPISNSANISPSRLPQINIKRENSEPMLSMPKYLQQMSGHRGLDDLPNNLLPSHEGHENDNPIPHPDPSNDIDGAEGSYLDSHHDSSPNNGESFKYPRKFDSHEMFGEMQLDPKYPGSARLGILPNYRNASSLSSINAFIGPPRTANISDEWLKSRNNMRHPPSEYDRTLKGDRLTNPNHQLTYHNMFTPSQEPGTLWRCRSCGKEVTNRWHHFHSHTAQRSMCPYCPATYSRIDTLRSHLKQKHKNEPQLKN